MYGEQTRIKGRHEDGYRQMVSRDEQDEGANEMAATLQDKTDNSLQASHLPLLRDGWLDCWILLQGA